VVADAAVMVYLAAGVQQNIMSDTHVIHNNHPRHDLKAKAGKRTRPWLSQSILNPVPEIIEKILSLT
jgi:hypothetical protein